MRHGDLSVGLETAQASVIVRRSAQKSSTMRGSQAQLPLDSGKTRLNDVNTYDPTAHRRIFDGRYFEYNGEHYGIGPDGLYIPNMKEGGDFIRLHAYKARGPLQGNDNVWADLSEKRMDIMPLIRLAIDDIGQHQESIKVQTSGLSPVTISKYLNWQANTLEGHLFEYKGRIFSLGFWIA